jgi:hypothetical protein
MSKGENETNYLHNITPDEMDTYLANFILSVRKKWRPKIWANNCSKHCFKHWPINFYKSDFHLTYRQVIFRYKQQQVVISTKQWAPDQTRSGENTADKRQTLPYIWATPLDLERDPVEIYKIYIA